MGCCFTKQYRNNKPQITVNLKYMNGQPYVEVIGDGVLLEFFTNKSYTKGISCDINGIKHDLIINIDNAYNGIMPLGPPFSREDCVVNIDTRNNMVNNYSTHSITRDNNLIQRSPMLHPYNDNPRTVIDMLRYVNYHRHAQQNS